MKKKLMQVKDNAALSEAVKKGMEARKKLKLDLELEKQEKVRVMHRHFRN